MTEFTTFSEGSYSLSRPAAGLALAVLVALALIPSLGAVPRASPAPPAASISAPFSASPTDDEFLHTGLFAQPLVPTRRTTVAENRDLAQALLAYQSDRQHLGPDAVDALVRFLDSHPDSAWKPVLLVDLGSIYRTTGHYSKALDSWQSAWALSKDLTDRSGQAVGDAAVAYLSQFEAYLGRKELLEPLLNEVKSRPLRGAAQQWVNSSTRGLADMVERPETSFRCGPLALTRILTHTTKPTPSPEARRVLDAAKSTLRGLSLTAVQQISADAGMNYQMAFRAPGARAITPAVAHWKVGHYAALLGRDPTGRFAVEDPTFGEPIRVTESTLDAEASGYFLVPPGPLPLGWRSVGTDEGDEVWGRGDTGANYDIAATGLAEIHAFPGCQGGGCTGWNVEAMAVGLSLRDDPVGYHPPVGPDVRITVSYSQRDMTQAQTFTSTNFGPQWTMSWLAQVVYYGGQQTLTLPPNEGSGGAALVAVPAAGTAASPDVTGENLVDPSPSMDYAVLFRRGGGLETFNSPESETPSVGIYSQSVLKALPPQSGGVAGSAGFLRTFPDGSTETYTTPGTSLATTSGIGPWLLTSIADPQGNAVTVHYDSQYRITSLVDAINESTAFQYNWPGDALKVSAIVDPFGRTASFTYDSMGRLASITDVLGIKSTYAYDSTDVDFVTALTTPYGPTQFSSATAPPPTDCGPPFVTSCTCAQTDKWVQATDPLGRTSRVESCDQAPGIPDTDTVVINGIAQTGSYIFPANMSLYGLDGDLGALLQFRNTFVWNPAQYDAAFSATGMDYTKAKIVHWLHTPDFTTTSRVPESTKEPLDNRIWYTYPGQTSALGSSIVLGTSNRPTGIGRVLPNGSTELWSYGYGSACNGYPYNQLCTVTDPVGRQLNYQYDPNNNIDLLSITAAGPSSSQALLLTTFGSYVAHRPGTFAGPSGEVTSYQYNGQGQLTQVTPPDPPDYGFTYDGKGNLTIVSNTSPLLPSTAYTLSPDSNNRLQTLTDSVGNSVTFSYDDADRVTRETFADGTTNQFSYTLLDLTDTTDRTGHSTTRLYSPDRELWQIDQAGRQTNLAYYPDGRLLAVSDPRGAQTLFGRDLEGRLTNTYYPGPPAQSYSWDTVGRLVSDPTATYAYNADETLQSITYPSGDYTTMLYDPVFRRLSSVNQYIGGLNNLASQVFYQYYATAAVPAAGSPPTVILGANRLESVTTYYENVANEAAPIFSDSVMYSYDSNDREASETISPENASLYGQSLQYDELGRIVQVTSFDNFLYGYSDNTARVTSVSTGLGPQASLSYYGATTSGEGTGDGLLQQLAYVSQTDSPLASWSYEYNANHQVTSLVDTTEPENLSSAQVTSSSPSYDPWGELVLNVVVQGNTTWNNAYQYDSSGNLNVAATEYQGDDYTATAANEISPDVFNTVYDANGNATTLGSTTYTWGDANRLASVTTGSQTSAFTYDAFGHLIRVVDSTGGTVTADHLYFWCGSRICLAHDNTQATEPVTKVYYDQGFVVPSGGSAQPYYYLKDALGSVRQVWTPQAQVGLTSYDPYGNVSQSRQASGAPASDIGYAGYFAHAGLDLAEHRAYTPTYARWLNRDPIGFAGGLNLYTYADNDPLSRSDPSGNCPWCIGAAAGFVAGGALGYYTSGGSWTATAEGAAAGALAGATGAFLGVLAGGGTLADALGVADLASVAIPGAAALQSQGENCGASIKNGEFREGAFSSWDPSIPQTGQYLNVGTDVTASQFQATLEANGFSIAQEGLSSNGPFAILTNGQTTYTIYTATSTGEASVQVFNSAGQTVLKYRLGL